jgi:hypothetical protein
MIQSLYQEIVVHGEDFVSVRVTPEAYARGARARPPRRGWGTCPPELGRPTAWIKCGVCAPVSSRDRYSDRRAGTHICYPYIVRCVRRQSWK